MFGGEGETRRARLRCLLAKDISPLTALEINVVVYDDPGGSVAIFRARERDSEAFNRNLNIGLDAAGIRKMNWDEPKARDAAGRSAAFSQMAAAASAMPHTRVEYVER